MPTLALLGALLVSAGALRAQAEASEGATEIFFETIDVNIVNVEVYVTDRQGNPVTDLTREDFELYEEGRRVPITNFFRVEGGRLSFDGAARPETAEGGEAVPQADGAPAQRAELPVPEEQRLHLVVFIDNLNIRPFNRNRVFRHLRGFLHEHVTRDDRVMLVTFDRSLKIRRTFTDDRFEVARALDELERVSGLGVHADSDRRELLRAIEEAERPGEILWRLEPYAESLYNDLDTTVSALRDFVDSLAGVPGRKAILYVSDGLPMMPGEDVFTAASGRFPGLVSPTRVHRFNLSRSFETLATQANGNRVTFYTLDAGGLRPRESVSVTARHPASVPFIDSIDISNRQSTLQLLSDRTGGRTVLNTNDFTPGLERIAVDFGNYYSLGFSPAQGGDGRYYRLEVKVKRPGMQVRHRDGYRFKPVGTRMVDRVEGALAYGLQSNPLELRLRVGDVVPAERDTYKAIVQVLIPTASVVLLEQGDRYVGRLRLYLSARDFEGGDAPVQEIGVPLALTPEQKERAYLIYPVEVTLRAGPQRIGVGVWDDIGSSASFVTELIDVRGR